jgi:circadian clock protein KaiB
LQDRHEIEVIDILRDPKRAMTDSVFMTPTLVKFAPPPERRMIGTLSQTQLISETIGLDPQHV